MGVTEESLAAHVVAWLEAQHWDVYQEVALYGGGDKAADIVAVRCGLVWVIECKTTFSLAVMGQAAGWPVHLRSVAVPWAKRNHDERALAESICRNHLQVGVLYVDPSTDAYATTIRERVRAPLQRHFHMSAQRIRAKLAPEHKTHAKAGSQGGARWTPYQQTMRDVKDFLRRQGADGAGIGQIMAVVGRCHYANEASAKQSIPAALEKYEAEWCEVIGQGRARRFRLKQTHREDP